MPISTNAPHTGSPNDAIRSYETTYDKPFERATGYPATHTGSRESRNEIVIPKRDGLPAAAVAAVESVAGPPSPMRAAETPSIDAIRDAYLPSCLKNKRQGVSPFQESSRARLVPQHWLLVHGHRRQSSYGISYSASAIGPLHPPQLPFWAWWRRWSFSVAATRCQGSEARRRWKEAEEHRLEPNDVPMGRQRSRE